VRLAVAGAIVVVVLSSCTADPPKAEPDPTPSATPPTTPSATPSTGPSTEPDRGVDELVVPAAAPSMPATWKERFVIPYGPGRTLLGTSPGGDSGTLDIGPEYGAPAPDGTWWFLDGAKRRLAHYDADGSFLDAVRIPRSMLVGRRYFQWQLPHVLADGGLLAVRQSSGGARLLRLRDGVLDEIAIDAELFSPTLDDGTLLYGFDGDNRQVTVDPTDGSVEPTDVVRTPAGTPFSLKVSFDSGRLVLELPDLGYSTRLPIRTASGAKAHVGFQVRAGADNTIHLVLLGAGEDDESVQLAGASSVSPTGAVSQVEPLTNPFSESDPGSPAQLVMAPRSSTPMLVYVLESGLHVYERTG